MILTFNKIKKQIVKQTCKKQGNFSMKMHQ